MPIFGDKEIKPDLEFPTIKDLENFPMTRKIKLQKISFQSAALHKIKFHFSNEIESPIYECSTPCNGLKVKAIDPTKTIRKVCIRLNKQNNFIFGVKILDDTGAELVNLFDSGAGYGEWQTQDIPVGKEIIGFYGNTM